MNEQRYHHLEYFLWAFLSSSKGCQLLPPTETKNIHILICNRFKTLCNVTLLCYIFCIFERGIIILLLYIYISVALIGLSVSGLLTESSVNPYRLKYSRLLAYGTSRCIRVGLFLQCSSHGSASGLYAAAWLLTFRKAAFGRRRR